MAEFGRLPSFFHEALFMAFRKQKLVIVPGKSIWLTEGNNSIDILATSFKPWKILKKFKTVLVLSTDPWLHPQKGYDGRVTYIHTVKDLPGTKYYPFWAWSFAMRRRNTPKDLIKVNTNWRQILDRKTEFCAFLSSHRSKARDNLFDVLSLYKPVTALGAWNPRLSSNMRKKEAFRDRMVYKDDVTYFDIAVEKYKPYKFVIAGENTNGLNGYVTEKIVNAMLAKAIPIYLGAPDISGK